MQPWRSRSFAPKQAGIIFEEECHLKSLTILSHLLCVTWVMHQALRKTSWAPQQYRMFYKFGRFLPCIDGNDFNQWVLPNLWQIQSCSPQTFSIILFLTQQSHGMTFKGSTKMQSVQSPCPITLVLICSFEEVVFILQRLKMRMRYNNVVPPAGAFKKRHWQVK